ncbi:MAG: hypothetical protein E7619_01320 [Ruminococcaceae bacterium]|nr:hypothetical protein [Oscillospiraceae bacterium]
MKQNKALLLLLLTFSLLFASCQTATPPEVTDAPDTPAVIDTLPPESDTIPPVTTEAPKESETIPPATDTTEAATTAAEDTTAPTKEEALLNTLLAQWEKYFRTKPEKTYINDEFAIVSRYSSYRRSHQCMIAYYNADGIIVCIDTIYVGDGWMQDATPAIYDRISYFEEAFNTTVTKYTFTDQKLLMSVKNNVPNNVESFDINDLAGKYIVKIVDGVVFNEKVTELILFPPGRTGSYTVPDGVTKIADGAFNHSKLSEVIIPASVTEVGTAFDKAPNIKIVREESK